MAVRDAIPELRTQGVQKTESREQSERREGEGERR